MEFNRFESSRIPPFFAPTDSHYQLPSSIPMISPPEHHRVDGGYFGPDYASYHKRQGSQGTGIANTEESDTASRSRLTQEQLAHLEREFQQRFKPNTEYKRGLAESMGVEYQKVNNWFQNRRAKAKHQTSHEPRFDLSTDEEVGEFPTRNLPHHPERMHQPHPSAHFSSPEHGPFLTGDFPANLDFHSLNHAPPQYNIHPDALTDNIDNITANSNYGSNGALQPNFSNVVGTEPMWPAHDLYGLSMPKMPALSIMEQDPFGWSPVSSGDHLGQLHGSGSTQSNTESHGPPMYHNTINGDLVGNPSSQTFVTASSEDGEHAKLITPPQETSPMPEPNQGIFPRRDSNSSDLAEDFDTIHLQQRQLGLGLYTTNPNPTSAPDHASSNGLATPDISPDPATIKPPSANGHDLASRRKRPRPPTLQPESGRSVSYGPMTMSPHLRVSSPGSGKMSPVRRIKSTGNNLNVMTGRVAKPGSVSAQMSPRNFESCFQVVKTSESKPNPGLNAIVAQASGAETHGLNSSSPATFAPKPQPPWPEYPSQYGPVSDQGSHNYVPTQFAAAFSLPPSPPVHSHATSPPLPYEQLSYPQHFSYHCPPQSAPSHITTFFDTSPPMGPGTFTPVGWPTPSITPPEPSRDGMNMPVPLRPNIALQHSQSAHSSYFQAPQHNFQGFSSGIGAFQPPQHPLSSMSTPTKKELDIKIEKGPPPPRELSQLSQEHKTYTFNHSTPEDFSPATNSKK